MLQEVATGSLCFSCSSCMKRGFSSCLKQELPQLFAKSLWGMKRMLRPFPRLWTSLELAVTGEGRAHCLVPVAAGTTGWWLGDLVVWFSPHPASSCPLLLLLPVVVLTWLPEYPQSWVVLADAPILKTQCSNSSLKIRK